MRRLAGGAVQVAAMVLVCLAIVVVRVVWSSRVALGEAQARAGDPRQKRDLPDRPDAIDLYGRAARLYAPGNPYAARALFALQQIARGAEAAGDRELALSAWREVRSAVLATRSFYTPHRDALATANDRIALLSAALESPSVDPGADEAARTRWHAERLAQDQAPSVGWSLAALIGFAAWIACAIGFFFRGLDARDRLRPRAALGFGAGIAVGFVVFLVGIARA